jgi:hypothetical protein
VFGPLPIYSWTWGEYAMTGRTNNHYRVFKKRSPGNTGSLFAEDVSLPFKFIPLINGECAHA